jgi:putative flavoprotein involved in K+ transport
MFTRTAQPGLWFIAGSLAQCRIYSKYLALQIKACEVGLLPRVRVRPESILTGSAGISAHRLNITEEMTFPRRD